MIGRTIEDTMVVGRARVRRGKQVTGTKAGTVQEDVNLVVTREGRKTSKVGQHCKEYQEEVLGT